MSWDKLESHNRIKYYQKEVILVSPQKAGRTWLRMILAKILNLMEVDINKYEMIYSTHYYAKNVLKLFGDNIKVLFLIRDPKDLVISHYFGMDKHLENYKLKKFIKNEKNGVRYFINYLNNWIENIDEFKDNKIISYEELNKDTFEVIKKVLDFLNFNISNEVIEEAIEFSRFDNMRNIEITGKDNLLKKYKGKFGKSTSINNDNSFRTRRGEIGGYMNYCISDDLNYMIEKCKHLNSFYNKYNYIL